MDSDAATTKSKKSKKLEFDEFSNRMIGCAIGVHWHVGPELEDGLDRLFLGYPLALCAGDPGPNARATGMCSRV